MFLLILVGVLLLEIWRSGIFLGDFFMATGEGDWLDVLFLGVRIELRLLLITGEASTYLEVTFFMGIWTDS